MAKKVITTKVIKQFLFSTGFPFEMQIAKRLRDKGYEVEQNTLFFDLEENKYREIDLIAEKKINDVNIKIIVECKQSLRDAWVFVSPEKLPGRYWPYAKHLPEIEDRKNEQKCFNDLHVFDKSIPLANNFTTYDIHTKKKSDPTALTDALHKVIKATISSMSNHIGYSDKCLFFSFIIFSNPVFIASYNKRLSVKKRNWIQYKMDFNSTAYEIKSKERLNRFDLNNFIGWQEEKKIEERNHQRDIYSRLNYHYIIDILTPTAINQLMKRIDSEVSKIPLKSWIPKSRERVGLLGLT